MDQQQPRAAPPGQPQPSQQQYGSPQRPGGPLPQQQGSPQQQQYGAQTSPSPQRASGDGAPALRRGDSQLSRQSRQPAPRQTAEADAPRRREPASPIREEESPRRASPQPDRSRRNDRGRDDGRGGDSGKRRGGGKRSDSEDSRRGRSRSEDSPGNEPRRKQDRRDGGDGRRRDERDRRERRRSGSRSSGGESGSGRSDDDGRRGGGGRRDDRRRSGGRDKRDSRRSQSRSDYSEDFEEDSRRSGSTLGTATNSSRTFTGTGSTYTGSTYTGTTGSGATGSSGSYFTDDTASRDERDGGRDKYKGDLSRWGKKTDPATAGYSDVSDSTNTLSSGLSPRDTHPRTVEFDVQAAKKTLAYTAAQYGRAQALRRDGLSPHHVGISEDLPDRFAYEQLSQLAGMASKVQSAIEHNKLIFERRMRMEDHVVKKKVFDGWRALKMGTLAQQQILKRAIARLARGNLYRAFDRWRNKFHLVDKNFAMRRKLTRTIQRGMMKRCFTAWRGLCHDRHADRLIEMREANIRSLELQIAGFVKRPIQVLRRRKLFAIMEAWANLAAWRGEKNRIRELRLAKAVRHMLKAQYTKAWNAWMEFTEIKSRHRKLLKKAGGRMKNLAILSAWNKWTDLIESKRRKTSAMGRVARHWRNRGIARGWEAWTSFVAWRKEKKKIAMRWMHPMLGKAFYGWLDNAAEMRRNRVIVQRAANRMRNMALASAWYTWRGWLEDEKSGQHMESKEKLAVRVEELAAENERLRRDNERFVRLIDSGEWGRGRVAELVAAGEILKGERDALLKLIQSLRREYENVQQARGTHEDELRSLKERMVLGGAARNKMLVKGGSSFNALVRAMKQDLLDGGPAGAPVAARDPNLLYAVDKLSMDHVTVFPDGELNVQALASVPASATFARPISTSRGPDRRAPVQPYNAPMQPGRTPQGLAYLGGPPPQRGNALPGRAGRPLTGAGGGAAAPGTTQRVLDALQGLSPAEINKLEAALRAERSGAGDGRPAGMTSSVR